MFLCLYIVVPGRLKKNIFGNGLGYAAYSKSGWITKGIEKHKAGCVSFARLHTKKLSTCTILLNSKITRHEHDVSGLKQHWVR